MYKKFFGLQLNPFGVNPDPRFLFFTRHAQESLACLTYGIQSRKGFVLLTGEVGTGKTTLLNKFFEWLQRQKANAAFIFNPRLKAAEFLDFMLADFGIPCESSMKSRQLWQLNHWLLERYRAGEATVLIVDEAQAISLDVLEEIRLLTNLETSNEKLLQIVLCGQPELDQKLKQPQLRQLRQRIALRCKTTALTVAETTSYIAQRLRIAGANGTPIFTPEAIEVIHQYSRGIPRVINLLCEHALIGAFIDQQRSIPARNLELIAKEFDLHQVSPAAPESSAGEEENVILMEAMKKIFMTSPPQQVRHAAQMAVSETRKESQ